MTLKELKKMIAEEYSAFLKEQDMPPMGPGGPTVDVSDNDVDATGGGDAEATLKKIMDMLTDYFEGGDEEMEAPEMPDAPADDEEEEEEEEDVNENSSGKHAGYKELKESKKVNKTAKIIAENAFKNRFKKLANIK